MAIPCSATGSLCPCFQPVRLVCLAVKPAFANALTARLPFVLSGPWKPPLLFWRRPPQSNYPPSGVLPPRELGLTQRKGGISTAAHPGLAPRLLSLPPILHIRYTMPALRYSKGSRGLFVPLRVGGIFTATTISPSSWLRQCPDRYTIRAGRNLPDKEFRYLRTVIVTAAVYRGFNSELRLAANSPS